MQEAIVGATFQRIGGAVTSRRESSKLHLAILTGKMAKGPRQLDINADNVRCQANEIGHMC